MKNYNIEQTISIIITTIHPQNCPNNPNSKRHCRFSLHKSLESLIINYFTLIWMSGGFLSKVAFQVARSRKLDRAFYWGQKLDDIEASQTGDPIWPFHFILRPRVEPLYMTGIMFSILKERPGPRDKTLSKPPDAFALENLLNVCRIWTFRLVTTVSFHLNKYI